MGTTVGSVPRATFEPDIPILRLLRGINYRVYVGNPGSDRPLVCIQLDAEPKSKVTNLLSALQMWSSDRVGISHRVKLIRWFFIDY